MDHERETLLGNASELSQALLEAGFDTGGSASQIVPVIVGSNEDALQAAEHLQGKGFAVRAIRPPTVPAGSARLRLSLSIRIPLEELRRLVHSLVEWREGKTAGVAARYA